ncbi:hypothetical protein CSC70_04870 [Pseudoxanthomonas kalamensis DSM 18571]|uniref:hypothetical protein n=1 Tax=Pseudoxanthomonas kalamensis TaxID=289483 RepID=UPI0013916156|nr:hypothetical protein [Pseudoxanthomonas kalamensis]KAF1711251.1 hypothetical protein CSC70_04870 [Pseudoxanthomonas kalamensis DSM 18571]
MHRHIRIATVLLPLAMAQVAIAQVSQPTLVKPVKPVKPVIPAKQVTPPNVLKRPPLFKPGECLGPDPAITEVGVQRLRRTADGKYYFDVFATVRNLGKTAWSSGTGQQSLTIRVNGRNLPGIDFTSLEPGQERGQVDDQERWAPYNNLANTVTASITYDPDIYADGNKANDDCNPGNNQKTLSSTEVIRLLQSGR